MSVKAMSVVWESDLPRAEKMILLAYADHADHEGGNVFPALGRIAWKTGYSKRQVIRLTNSLVELGYLLDVGVKRSGTTIYRINLSALPKLAPYLGGDKMSPLNNGGGDKMSPGGVTKCHRTSDTMSPKPSYNHQYNQKEEEEERPPLFIHPDPEPLAEMKTALAGVVVEVFAPGYNEEAFDAVAHALLGEGFTAEDVPGFGPYWRKNGFYKTKPHLKTLVTNFKAYMDQDEASADWLDDIAIFAEGGNDAAD